ncbi:unnamed protein product [Pieris macdunnoughi]|uniref:Uncharacterized protein n=1 Tax=Pieris macdunnoughi TaxID=345717 RepID=A0A821UYI5_9NEOP|nr:unnamed protein product [Pieris macdunnoughi]
MSAKKRRLKNGAIPSKNLPNIKATSSGPRATQLCDIEDNKLKEPNNYERAPFKKMLKDGANNSDSLAECRACLQLCSVEEQHNLFKFWDPPWAGMQNTPAEDLSKLACVQISQTDAHSKILCQSCYKHLQNACQFVEIVKKADEVLSLRIGVNPHTPDSWPKPIQVDKNVPYDKVQIKDEIFSDEETQQMNEEDFSNVDVKIEADDWPSQSVHINGIISLGQLNKEMAEINGYLPEVEQNGKTKGLTSEGPITNGVVNSKHDKADSFNTNCLIVRVKEEPVSDAESETNASDLSLDCILCSKTFLSLTGLKAHVIAQHTYKTVRRKTIDDAEDNLLNYVCKICQRRFETSTDLMVHETCHNMCVCYGCNTSFETFDQLSQHRRSCKSLKNSEVGKVLKLEDVQRMANIAQRILEVITKFTIFSQNSEHGNIDECYQALLAVITQKEDSICDDLSSDDDDLYNLSDLESVDDTLLEYNKHFLSDLDLQKKSSKLIESSVMEHNVTSQTDDGFYSMEHSFKAIGKLLSYPVVKITRLQSPILQNYKSSYLYDNQSDTASSYEDFEELDEFLLAEDLLISIDKRADGVEKQMAKEDDNQLSNSEFSTLNTEVDTSKDLLLHSDFNDIHEKSLSSGFLPLNASNSITEEENIAILEFDDDDDDFHSDNVAVCLDILDKYVSTENYENFGKSSSQTSSKVELKSSFALNVANTNLNPVANDEIINLIDESNDIDNLKKPCIVQPISVNINTSIGQIPKKITTGIASSALTLFNINEPRVIQNASITNANLVTTPLGTSGDKTINYMKNIAETSCALKSNIINEQCSSISAVLNKQTETGEMNLSNFYKLHDNETHKIEKHTIKKKAYVRATDVNISENNSKVQTAKLSTSIIVECENDVIGCDNDKEPSSRELPSSVTCDANSQTFEPLSLPRLVGVNNKFIFRYRSTRKIRRGCKMDCKFSCRKIFTSHLRYNKFKDFWKMDLSAQSKFLDDNVVKKVSRKLLPRNRFFLPISNESVRVCRKFIEDTFSILMLSYRKELRKYNMSFDDYYSNVRKKDTKVLDCYKKQTLSKCVSTIHIFKENETNGDGDTKQWDDCVIKKTNNMAQRNYGAEKCCISSIHRDIKTNATSGDTPIVHYSMKNGHKKLVDQTRSEINKHMSEPNLKICSKKSKFERVPTLRKNDSASGASNIKKRYRFNNITINVSTSDKVSFSRSNPYVKLIDVGFYTQLHSLDVPETSSTNSTQTHSQLVQNIDISNLSLVQNVDPSPSYQSDKNNLSCRIDTDLDIPNKDSDSQSILENEVKTNLPHSSFEDFQTSKDINCQSILQEKLKTEMAHPSNENQQISNVTNGRTLLKGEIKTKSLPLVIEEFQASDEKSNNYSTSHNIEGQDPCSFVEDLPKLYVKSNKQPLLNHPKITNYQDSTCHSPRNNIDDHLPHLPTEDSVPSNDGSNLEEEIENKLPLSFNPNPQCTNDDSKCNDMQNHIMRLSGEDLSNKESENEQSMAGEIEHNEDSSYHSDSARNISDDHLPHLPTEDSVPSNDGSNVEEEIENKLPLSLNPNPQCTNDDSKCDDMQNHIMRLSGEHLSNKASGNEQSMAGEIEHNEDSSYHSDSARNISDDHLPHLPTEDSVPSNDGSNVEEEIENKLPLSLNANPQCTNDDSKCDDMQNHIMRLSGEHLSNKASGNEQSMAGEIEHNEDSSYHSDSARNISDDHLPHLPTEDSVPSNDGSNLEEEIENTLPLSLNPNPQCTNDDSKCNDMQNHIMRLSGEDLSNKESENEQSIAVEIKHNEDSSCHSIRQDQIKNHLPHISNENLLKSNDESNGRSNLPLSSYIEITNAFCEDLCDSQINYGDSNSQNIIHALNDDPQTYAEASARPTIEEETSIETLTHPFHADLQICYENDPKIAQAFNRSNTFEHTNTNLQMGNKDIIKQQNVKTNLSHLTITNSLTYNKDNGESNCHSSSNILESQISIHESNYSQMSSKCTVPENTPEIYVEGLFHPESQLLIDAKRNLKQHYQKKSNHFKLQRIIGKGHKFIFRYKVTRSLRPGCQHCTYKCTQVIGFDQRRVLFENFWKMDIHAQTTYLNENVFLINPILGLHDINETRMKRNHKFFFTVYGKRFRVCKKFFLNTLSILMADLKNDSSRLKVMRQRLNPYVKLIDIGFHKEPQPAIEDVSSVSNTSSGETSVSVSWNDSLDSYSELELYSLHTKIELSNQLHNPPKKFMLEAINDNAFQSNSSDSQSQSPVYAQLSTVDQHFDNEIVTNINSSNVEPCDKNTHLMKPHEINSIGPFITNVTQAGNKEQSFKAILNDWSKPQDLDKHKRAPFKCTTNSNQYSNKNCTHTIYMETKSDSFYEIGDKLKNMDICYESSLDSANTSMLDLRQTISVPNFLDCDNHINTVYFDSETYERSDTEEFSKDSQIQNDSALSSLSSAGTNPGVESQTDIQEDKVTDALQLSTQKECAVYELSKNIDSVFIETAQDINNAMNRSERQLDHRERGNTIPTTALTDSLPTFTESINNGSTKLTNSVYVLNKINISSIDQNTSVINIDEERSLDTTEQHTNVIQDNTYLNEQLHPNQASDTSNISMESFKCSNLNIEISNQTYQSSSNTDSLTTETDGVVTPIQDKNNSNNGVTLLSDLDVQNQNYHNTKVNPSSSPEGTSFTYTDFYNSSSEDPESNEMQLINDNRLESDYAQLSNVYEPTRVESYLITKDTYYGTESSCSQFSYDTRSTMNCSKSSLDFYPSFDSQNVIENVECDVPQSFESILNDWAS